MSYFELIDEYYEDGIVPVLTPEFFVNKAVSDYCRDIDFIQNRLILAAFFQRCFSVSDISEIFPSSGELEDADELIDVSFEAR